MIYGRLSDLLDLSAPLCAMYYALCGKRYVCTTVACTCANDRIVSELEDVAAEDCDLNGLHGAACFTTA